MEENSKSQSTKFTVGVLVVLGLVAVIIIVIASLLHNIYYVESEIHDLEPVENEILDNAALEPEPNLTETEEPIADEKPAPAVNKSIPPDMIPYGTKVLQIDPGWYDNELQYAEDAAGVDFDTYEEAQEFYVNYQ